MKTTTKLKIFTCIISPVSIHLLMVFLWGLKESLCVFCIMATWALHVMLLNHIVRLEELEEAKRTRDEALERLNKQLDEYLSRHPGKDQEQ